MASGRLAKLAVALLAAPLAEAGCGFNCGSGGCSSCSGWSDSSFCQASEANCAGACGGLWCPAGPSPGPSPAPGPGPAPSPGPAPGPAPGPSPAPTGDRCDSANVPKDTRCTGCPPMKDGKLCASTTHYNDPTKGACGCGNSDPVPQTWWTKTQFTAALNCKNLDPAEPTLAWCPSQCGGCYRLCSTGGTTQGESTKEGVCHVFKIDNRCGDGFDSPRWDYWCSQELTFQECQQDPAKCKQKGSTNWFGYSAHFDLQDINGQIAALGWNNPEVTFEPVSCSEWTGPSWDCQCHGVGQVSNTSSAVKAETQVVV